MSKLSPIGTRIKKALHHTEGARFLTKAPLFLTLISLLAIPVYYMRAGNLETERVREVMSLGVNELPRGGPVPQSYSTLFLVGQRANNGSNDYARVSAGGYGEGPAELLLASTIDGSLFKHSSPLTIAAAANTRAEITNYTVKPGDAPSVIAASFGITTNTLLWANNLADGDYIRTGEDLIILPVSGVRYKIKSGDTLSGIARRFNGDLQKMLTFNGLDVADSISEGDYIVIPDGEMPALASSRSYAVKYAPYSQNIDGYFIHPTAGAGYKSRGIHNNNAVDIAAYCWAPIYAAADGIVSIADSYGWNGGYGKYVKIVHPNNTATLYSHNIQNEVSAGQQVKQGQLIAYMGSTGHSTGCHVHWEVYEALNPLR